MDNFVAIDFETANFAQSSVCSVGLVIVKDGEIVDNYYSLIRPIPNYYNAHCSEVHGLHFDDTNDAPETAPTAPPATAYRPTIPSSSVHPSIQSMVRLPIVSR